MQGKSHLWVVVGDIHDHAGNFTRIPELAEAAGVIISGDLTNLGGAAQARQVLDTIGQKLPVLAQIGNMDKAEVGEWLTASGVNIHGQVRQLTPEIAIFGIGGSTPTPFATPSEFAESAYSQWLADMWPQAQKYQHTVLISHNPPKNTPCDDIGGDVHVGSGAVRDFIEEHKPDLCVCGHIHEGKAVTQIGPTTVINPGQLADGGYVVMRLEDGKLTAELRQVAA